MCTPSLIWCFSNMPALCHVQTEHGVKLAKEYKLLYGLSIYNVCAARQRILNFAD